MDVQHLKETLLAATDRLAAWSFDELAALSAMSPWTEEVGVPAMLATGSYCQIEAALLDRFVEDGFDTLHMTVFASDCAQKLGTDFLVRQDGQVHWDRKVYRFVGGVPQETE